MTANSLLAAAMAGGEDGLSQRDCLLCLAYTYAGGNSAQTKLNLDIQSGFDKLSWGDIWKCIAALLNGGASPILTCVIVSGAGTSSINGTYNVVGQMNGRNLYQNGSNTLNWTGGFGSWILGTPLINYTSSSDVQTPDLAIGWSIGNGASNPPPTVTHC